MTGKDKDFRSLSSGKTRSSKKKERYAVVWAILRYLIRFSGLAAIWGIIGIIGIIFWFGHDLPNVEELSVSPRQPNVKIFDQQGSLLATYGEFHGQPIQAKELPKHVVNALLATEDRRFYTHYGIDPIGIVRALLKNTQCGGVVHGGSTITQQLAKNFLFAKKMFPVTDRSLKRKISEALLAVKIENRFSKEEILTMYLNRMYMGSGTYGIDAAARRYFGKSAHDLGLYESAILIGLLQAPTRYAPTRSPERSEERARQVLCAMVESGFITKETAQAAMAMPEPLDEGARNASARYFADWIFSLIPECIETTGDDLEVVTTLSQPLQRIAEKQAARVMELRGKLWKAEQLAMVVMKPDGAVQAIVGGLDYRKSPYNRATQAFRQPGSAFKYFVYLTALEQGFRPFSMVSDARAEYDGWAPSNYEYKARGRISVGEAFARSVNSVAVRLADAVGIRRVIAMAKRLGITSPLRRDLTLSLGTSEVTLMEMTGAFAVMANEGWRAEPYGILRIRNAAGKLLYKHGQKKRVDQKKTLARKKSTHDDTEEEDEDDLIDEETVADMKEVMKGVMDYGTGRYAKIDGVESMGKTGTTQSYKDLWLIAMNSELVTGVWFGRDDAKAMERHTGGAPTSILWKAFNTQALAYLKNPKDFDFDSEVPLNLPQAKKVETDDNDAAEDDDDDDDDEDSEDGEEEEEAEKPIKRKKKEEEQQKETKQQEKAKEEEQVQVQDQNQNQNQNQNQEEKVPSEGELFQDIQKNF